MQRKFTKYPSSYVRASLYDDNFSASKMKNVIAEALNVSEDIASIIYDWYDAEGSFDDFDDVDDFVNYLKDDIYDMLDAASEPIRSKVAHALDIDIYDQDEEEEDQNENTGRSVFDYYDIASDPNTPVDVLIDLFNENDSYANHYIAYNPNTPMEIVMQLAKDPNVFVREGVATNPNIPVEILNEFADYYLNYEKSHKGSAGGEYKVAVSVAWNPSSTIEILKKLAKSPNHYVNYAATTNLEKRGIDY